MMREHRGGRFGFLVLVAIAVAIGAGLLGAPQVSAQDPTASVDSITVGPGEQGTVDVRALDIDPPGLGAWEIGVTYDSSLVTALSCAPANGSVCNADFASNEVRITGASAGGLEGDTTLATITFRCDGEGSSTLAATVLVFADATLGEPQAIGPAVQNGQITCSDVSPPGPQPTQDDEPSPTNTPVVAGLPPSGSGGSGGGSVLGWLIAASAIAGLAAITGLAALRQRARV